MSLAQIEYFLAVSETGNVGRAAATLRIAQPAVSRQIRSLEDELGARLFIRTPRGMQLSAAGDTFLPHAQAVVMRLDEARRAVGAASRLTPTAQQQSAAPPTCSE